MAATSDQKRYVLKGFDDVLDGRRILLVHDLPANVAVCMLCATVSSEHYSLACGHVYCTSCFFGSVQKHATFLQCPLDGKHFRPRTTLRPCTTGIEEVYGLAVYCWNRDHGCMRAATLEDMLIHLLSCPFFKVTFSICSSMLLRLDLDSHVQSAHSKRRSSRRHSVAARASDLVASEDADTSAKMTEHIEAPKQSAASVLHALFEPLTDEQFLPFVEGIASATAADVKQHSKAISSDILNGLALINDRLTTFAMIANASFPRLPNIEHASDTTATNPHQCIRTREE